MESRVRFISCALLLALLVSSPCVRTSDAADLSVSGSAGLSLLTDEVGDHIAGPGVLFGGRFMVFVNPNVLVGAGGTLSIHDGRDLEEVPFTDAAVAFTVEGSGLIYLLDEDRGDTRPFLGLSLGYGALAWGYSREAEDFMGIDSDAVGFLFAAPEVGIEVGLAEGFAVFATFRFVATRYFDETAENFEWDLDGGHCLQVCAGGSFRF